MTDVVLLLLSLVSVADVML